MSAAVSSERSTFIPSPEDQVELESFRSFLESAPNGEERQVARLIGQTGEERELPAPLYEVLVAVAEALSEGRGVTVMPNDQQMTTQEAADFLSMSRPSLVKLLEGGEIRFTKVGRHRRVRLSDLVAYETGLAATRKNLLDTMSREGFASGKYFALPEETEAEE